MGVSRLNLTTTYDNPLRGGFGRRPRARDCGTGRGMTVLDLPFNAKV